LTPPPNCRTAILEELADGPAKKPAVKEIQHDVNTIQDNTRRMQTAKTYFATKKKTQQRHQI